MGQAGESVAVEMRLDVCFRKIGYQSSASTGDIVRKSRRDALGIGWKAITGSIELLGHSREK